MECTNVFSIWLSGAGSSWHSFCLFTKHGFSASAGRRSTSVSFCYGTYVPIIVLVLKWAVHAYTVWHASLMSLWFYGLISIAYDHVFNPPHWNKDMKDGVLEPADLCDPRLKVVDVGGGTGFATFGIIKHIDPENVTLLDQSPHQLAKAKAKEALKDCTIMEGDAEDLPFPTDSFDRYISAGSIEYWPDPQRGIREAYRVLKPGGIACIIGPVYPTFWLSRFFADMWMLFPKEEEYIEWFNKAGFKDVKLKRIGPKWYRGVRRYGLIIGCSVTGVKRESGDSPLQLGTKEEDVLKTVNPFAFLMRFILGTIAAVYFVLVPIYMWIKDKIVPKGRPI